MPWAWEQPACRSSSFFFHCISPQIWSHRSTWLIRQILRTNFASLRCSPEKTFSNCGAICPSDELAYGTGDVRAGKLTFGRKSHILPSGRLPPRNGTAMGARHAAENRERVRVQLCELKIARRKKKKEVWWKRVHVEELRMADDYVAFCARCRFLRRKARLQNTFIVFLGRMILCSLVRPAPQRPRCPVCHHRPDCIAKVIEGWINSQAISTSAVAALAYRSLAYPT